MKLSLRSVFAIGILLYSCDDALASSRDGEFEPIKEINGVPVILRPLDNSKCTKISPVTGKREVVFRDRKDDEQQVRGIVVHYSVCPNADVTESTFYSNGVSSHYYVDSDGKKFEFVDPKYVAFHAGKSAWDGRTSLNKFFIGVEQDMGVYCEEANKKLCDYKKFGKTVQLPVDDWKRLFSNKQVEAMGLLIFALQREYEIPGRQVVTHSDVAIGRKSDSGPMFPYEKIFKKYGAGYYPKYRYINLNKFTKLADGDYVKLLEIYGYGRGEDGRAFGVTDNQIVKAFKLHFYPGDLSYDLTDNTKKKIINLISDYYNYKDKIINSLDDKFRKDIDSFFSENKERTQELSDFVLGWNSYTKLKSNFLWISDFFQRFTDIFRKVDEKSKLK